MKSRLELVVGVLSVVWLLAGGSAVGTEEKSKPLTNSDVIKMLENKIPESVILSKIQASEVKFDTSTDAIIELNKKGVSEKVLNAMLKPKGSSAEGAKIPDPNPSATAKPPDMATPSPAATPGDERSKLSHGMVTGSVKKNVTTQLELLELFGGPSVMTTDKDGTEVWMYDKTTSTRSSEQSGKQARQSEASVMAGFFGIPLLGGVGSAKGKEKEQSEQEGRSTVASSVKTITFIIKFNPDKTVKEYSVRQATY